PDHRTPHSFPTRRSSDLVREALNANDPELRRVAVYSLGALDDLPGLVDALSNPRQPDVRAAAMPALQHWIGRGPGQDAVLYNFLDRKSTRLNSSHVSISY